MWLARLTQALWWWHPLAWLVARELRASAEEACDNWAIALTGQRQSYAGVLVEWAERAAAGGLSCAYRGKALVRRVKRVLQHTGTGALQLSWRARLIVAVCFLVAIVAVGTLRFRAVAYSEFATTSRNEQVTITGRVLGPDEQPVVGCRVFVLAWARHGFVTPETRCDATGRFSFTYSVKNRAYAGWVSALKPGLALDWALARPGEEIILRLGADPVACTGTVTDPDGNPIAGAQVSVYALARAQDGEIDEDDVYVVGMADFRPRAILTDTTDIEGSFQIRHLPPDAVLALMAVAQGRQRLLLRDQLPAGKQDIRIVLHPEATISGRVTRGDQPVAGIQVWCWSKHLTVCNAETVSAEDGTYVLKELSRGAYRVSVRAPEEYWAGALNGVALGAGEHLTGVDFQLLPTSVVEGVVTEVQTGRPIAGALISANRLDGSRPTIFAGQANTSELGRYVLRLPVGKNIIHYTGNVAGFPLKLAEPQSQRVQVVEGETLTGVDFVLRPRQLDQVSADSDRAFNLDFYFATVVEDETVKVPDGYKLMQTDRAAYLVRIEPDLTEKDVRDITLEEFRSYTGGEKVGTNQHIVFHLQASGAEALAQLTEKNIGKPLLIVLHGQVLAAPIVRTKISGGTIPLPCSDITEQQQKALLSFSARPPEIMPGTAKITVKARFADGTKPLGAECRLQTYYQAQPPPRTPDSQGELVPPTVVGADGDWVIYNVPAGPWAVQVRGDDFVWTRKNTLRGHVEVAVAEEKLLSFTLLRGGTVSGRVVSGDDGKPIRGVTVTARQPAGLGLPTDPDEAGCDITDAEGRYTLRHVGPGGVAPTARGQDYVPTHSERVEVEDEGAVTAPDIRLRQGGWISGHIVRPLDVPPGGGR